MALRLKDIREFLYEVRLKWYDLGIELDCDITDLDVIKLMHQNPKDCLREMIKNRLKFVDNPLTWSAIAKALSAAAVDEEELACKALANAQDSISSSPHRSPAISNKRKMKRSTIIHERPTSIIKLEIKALEDEFRTLIIAFRNQLDSKNEDVSEVHDTLLALSPRLHRIYSPVLEEMFHGLEKCETHRKLFFKLNICWNFIDYELFLHIVEKYGDYELKCAMYKYRDDVRKFRERTSVYQLVASWEDSAYRPYDRERYRKIVVRLDRNSKTCSLEELENLRKYKNYDQPLYDQPLSIAAIIFHDLAINCVTMVWLVAEEDASILFDSLFKWSHSDFVTRHAINFLSLDDHILYDPMNDISMQYWNACREGNSKCVREFLESRKVDPNYCCKVLEKQTVLMSAAGHGHSDVVDLLLQYQAAVDEQDETGRTALTIAAQAGHIVIAKSLLDRRADLNLQEKLHGMCPLLIAIDQGNPPVVRMSLCAQSPQADLNVANWEGKTALILAIEKGDVEILDALLDVNLESLNIYHKDEMGRTALHVAVENRNLEIVKRLIDIFQYARDVVNKEGEKPVDVARRIGDQEMVILFGPEEVDDGYVSQSNSEMTSQESLEMTSQEVALKQEMATKDTITLHGGATSTRLQMTSQESLEMTSQEVALKPEMATKDTITLHGGATSTRLQRSLSTVASFLKLFRPKDIKLMRAAKNGKHERVEELLQDKAAPNTTEIDALQWTPLIWASHRGHTETVEVLLKYGADPNITATNGFTALILASRNGHHDIVRLLLDPSNQIPADVNAKNKTRGWSALMWASQTYAGTLGTKRKFLTEKAMADRREVVKVLLEKGADVNIEANNGWTPMMQACQDGDVELVKILANSAAVKLDHQSKSKWSALTTACRKGREEIVKVLVDAGADVNLKKKGGITALHIASYKNMMDTVKLLLSAKRAASGLVDAQDDWGMTPLIMTAKRNFRPLMEYLIQDAKANVNLTAMKYAQWSALFFAVKSGNTTAVDLLLENKAKADITDDKGHTPLSYSKGLLLQKKVEMYKHLAKKQEATPTSHGTTAEATTAIAEKAFTPVDGIFYNTKEAQWTTLQLPNILLNI